MLHEVYDVLSPTGVYICISYGTPEMRESYFRNPDFDWEIHVHKVFKLQVTNAGVVPEEGKDPKNYHYIYVMRKKVGPKEGGAKEGAAA
jgi:hypothetical protein